ncbi:redoxin domain-containing protein [Roseimaritima sediminicola]|uniref:redoxin domain-containing protein n=1 Tax=Roseimaritima sediminicola TaxID=2662066 RepID=UPI0012984ED5|nr:redoxin domain-containing protein [Roseimaritima sediminicola]
MFWTVFAASSPRPRDGDARRGCSSPGAPAAWLGGFSTAWPRLLRLPVSLRLPDSLGVPVSLRLPVSLGLLGVLLLLTVPAVADEPVSPYRFDLPRSDGGSLHLTAPEQTSLQVVCFLGTECPLARLYGPRLQQLAERYADRVAFVGIVPNQQDSLEEIRRYRQRHNIEFPIAKDPDQSVTRFLGATRTPEVFVLDSAGRVGYQGRIDDQYQPGISRAEPTSHDLDAALTRLLSGERPEVAHRPAVGCRIAPRRTPDPTSDVTFADQVSRVLLRNCVECHREGEIGPFALTDYDEVVGWADMILEVVDNGRMPPWHAGAKGVPFENARTMSAEDRAVLHRWVEAGTPFGDASQLPSLPEKASSPDRPSSPDRLAHWRLPTPPERVYDISRKPFVVPAEGTVEYQYFVVDPGFEQDRWLSSAEVIPGNRAVVHHCIVFVRPPDGTDMREIGFLAAYVPGQEPTILPEGYARRVRAGSQFIVQMHYTPNGSEQEDLTSFGVNFVAEEDVTHEVLVVGGIEQEFEIPPRVSDHVVEGTVAWYPRDGFLLGIAPHMHVRGKSFRLSAQRGDSQQLLLDVPQYDFNWQHNYVLSEPLPLADVDRLAFRSVFDNSADNPNNPDPDEYVTWGDQTWEEMSVVFLQVARPRQQLQTPGEEAGVSPSQPAARSPDRSRPGVASQRRRAEAFAEDFLVRFDTDRDGRVSEDEVPTAFRVYQFRHTDKNRDGSLQRDELMRAALR